MGKRLKRRPGVEDKDIEGTMSSICEKGKIRNAASDLMSDGDTRVNSKESKKRTVRKQTVTRARKRHIGDVGCVTDGPVNVGCDDKDDGTDATVHVDDGKEVKTVVNLAKFNSSESLANPDCISPAAKLAKQLRYFKYKQTAGLTHEGDPMTLDVIFDGRQSPTEFADVASRTRKRRGNATLKRHSKQVNVPTDETSQVESVLNVPSSGRSSPTELTTVVENTGKRSRKLRGNTKVKKRQSVVGSLRPHIANSTCSDSQNARAPSEGGQRMVGRKRMTKNKAENSAGRKTVTKAAKLSVVDSCRQKTKQKQSVPRNGKKQPKVTCRRSVSAVGDMNTEVAVTGGGCHVPAAAGPSGEGGMTEASSDSESDWEEVDDLPGANLSVRDQLPTAPVEIILEAPRLKRGKKHKEVDIKTYFRRLMNRYKKETQLDMHKVHLLCLLCYGFHRNQICKDTMLQAVTLSLIPARFADIVDWDVDLLGNLTGWFKEHFSIDSHLPTDTHNLVAALVSDVGQACVSSQTELVFVFVAMLRSLGLNVRLVISLQPVPIKATDLDVKTSAGINKKMTVSGGTKTKSVKKVSKKGSSKMTSKDNATLVKAEVIKQEFDVDKIKQVGTTLSAKISAKCKVKTSEKKTACEEELGSGRIRGRPRRRVSKVNYAEGGQQEDGEKASEDGHSSKGGLCGDVEDENLHTGSGKGKGTGGTAKEDQGYVQEISDNDDDDFTEETVNMKVGCKARKPTKQKRKVAPSVSDESITSDGDGSGRDHWTEVFLPCEQSWICVDCVRARIAVPEKMERRATSPICYVVAFDNRNYVKDVTSRYASDWMHTTRKLRVSPEWWQVVLASYCDPNMEREKRENEELKTKFTEEPLPTTIGQYKNHPLYALKRHLLKFEAIYPPTALVLGYVRGEPVYSRECVCNLHSRETWLKEGLVVKLGEQPYKMVRARPKWHKPHENTTEPTLPIFGRWQTEIYVAPPAVDGKVPVNEYGNVELFQPTMLPAGTVHIRVPGLQKVAKKLNIDCPPAMMGWDFHGGYNHPVMDGWVVCEEHKEILLAAWDEDQEIQRQRDIENREARAVDNWKLLVKGLFIKQRLKRRYELQETASGSGGKMEDRPDPRPATDTALAWPQNRKEAQSSQELQNRGALFPFEMEHM